MNDRFYVYEHRRKDTGSIFYVGKGCGRRAWVTQHRSKFWWHVVKKSGGYDISIIANSLPEELAHLCEMERIDQNRRLGKRLCNLTDGGEGMSGYKFSFESSAKRAEKLRGRKRPDISARLTGVPKSVEHRRSLSLSRIGSKASEDTKRKMAEGRKGRPGPMLGKKHKPETLEKLRSLNIGILNRFYGKTHTPQAIEAIKAANIGRRDSQETRIKKSVARRGQLNPRFGVQITEEQKARQIASLMARPRVTCPHCLRTMDESNAKRWHFENCKGKK
jgi:hypothetical protein